MPRPVLSVILAFGLVNVPVRLYTAAVSKRLQFHLLDSGSGERVRQQLVSPGHRKKHEVRSPEEIAVEGVALSDTEVQLAQQVIDARATDHWNPDQYTVRIARACWSLSNRNAKVSLFRRKNACRVRR